MWIVGATSTLIDAWGERHLELNRGYLRQKQWKEIAIIVSSCEDYTKPPKTELQCKNRIDTLKKKYKHEKAKIASGTGPTMWPFFHRLDHLIDPTAQSPVPTTPTEAHNVPQHKHKHKHKKKKKPFRGRRGSMNSNSS
ncbi:hypothetical protein HHK36_025368 [Tetracentron sinense]|uniref:Myb/SANT-like DNA-binding domain-containing protein n=1 Tax=Tetracentron sinense TaxID=13715 RepID=A0A834YL22_TETSI|nr:hypothetical protein HHK36_025368 [Tetracentron sinense]